MKAPAIQQTRHPSSGREPISRRSNAAASQTRANWKIWQKAGLIFFVQLVLKIRHACMKTFFDVGEIRMNQWIEAISRSALE